MNQSKAILYSFRRCPYAMRARLAIVYAQCHLELREIILKDKPKSLLEYSPKGTVPVLIVKTQDNETQVIDESLDIMLWALQQHDPDDYLRHMALDQILIAENDGSFKLHLDQYKYPNRFDNTNEIAAREIACEFIQKLDQILQTQAFLGGQQASLADMAIFPFVRQFAHVDLNWFAASDYQQVKLWLQTWLESPLFKSVMKKYAPWQGDKLSYLP